MNINYEKMWEELDKVVMETRDAKMPHEKTIDQLSSQWHMGKATARRVADAMVKKGLLTVRDARSSNGRITKVYAPIQK